MSQLVPQLEAILDQFNARLRANASQTGQLPRVNGAGHRSATQARSD